uniref:Condensation domain-containing protein n=1 Tax=Chryseobacterium sp. B5 TaxID=2050562 RepID=A0A2G7T5C6_9FLAO
MPACAAAAARPCALARTFHAAIRPALPCCPMPSASLWLPGSWRPTARPTTWPAAWTWKARWTRGAMAAALDDLVARHDILRTRITAGDDGQALQAVQPMQPDGATSLQMPVVDMPTQAALEDALAGFAQTPFALDRQAPLRACLYRLDAQRHVLALSLHHIAADGWSLRILVDELLHCYEARLRAQPPRTGTHAHPVRRLRGLGTPAPGRRRARAPAALLARTPGSGTRAAGAAPEPCARRRDRRGRGPAPLCLARRAVRCGARAGAGARRLAVHGHDGLAGPVAVPPERPAPHPRGHAHCQPGQGRDAWADRLSAQPAGAAGRCRTADGLWRTARTGAPGRAGCAAACGPAIRHAGRGAGARAPAGRASAVPGQVHAAGRHGARAQCRRRARAHADTDGRPGAFRPQPGLHRPGRGHRMRVHPRHGPVRCAAHRRLRGQPDPLRPAGGGRARCRAGGHCAGRPG